MEFQKDSPLENVLTNRVEYHYLRDPQKCMFLRFSALVDLTRVNAWTYAQNQSLNAKRVPFRAQKMIIDTPGR